MAEGEDGIHKGGEGLIIFPVIALIIGLILDEVNKKINFLGIPDSVLQFMVAMGVSVSLNKFLPSDIAMGLSQKYTWTNLHPEMILLILLPPLIFEAAFKINTHMFLARLNLILSVTIFCYFLTLLISFAFLLPLLINTENCKISSVLIFLSIIVATDPVAVVAILEQYGAPHRLRIVIEGESLLNDGLALTAYRILAEILKKETKLDYDIDYNDLAISFLTSIFISPLMGFIGALIVAWIVIHIHDNKKRQALILVSVYFMFILCEHTNGSPALGLVIFGITLSYNKERMSPDTRNTAIEIWQTLAYWATNVIFIFAGYFVGYRIFMSRVDLYSRSGYLNLETEDLFTLFEGILISPVPLFARIASIYLFYKFYGFLSRKSLPPKTDFTLLSYAGLRGALGLILAMELNLTLGSPDSNKILLLTCSTTFMSLVFQGMTFSSLATKEGTTKRSRYVKDTCVRLSRFLSNKVNDTLHSLQTDRNSYIKGSNWRVVETQVKECLAAHAFAMEHEMQRQQNEEQAEDMWSTDNEDEDSDALQKESDVADARTGFYGILLARVHDSWERGAVSGSTAHIIISLLEHGIDEGNIKAKDIEEHLAMLEFNLPSRILSSIAYTAYNIINVKDNCLIRIAEAVIGKNLFGRHSSKVIRIVPKRSFEKWWIFHSFLHCLYCIMVAAVVFDTISEVTRASTYIVGLILWFITSMELIYLYKRDHTKHKERGDTGCLTYCRGLFSLSFLPSLISFIMITAAIIISINMMDKGKCIQHISFNNSACNNERYIQFCLILLNCLHKITISIPVLIVILNDHYVQKKLARDRIRLAVFHYLHYLMDAKISRDLFSENVYKSVMKESKKFNRLVEGLVRLELKENAEEMDVVPVIKTRQAVRMMSFALSITLCNLKTEGFMPEDSRERWDGVVSELRARAESILYVPPLNYSDWMQCVKWIRQLKARKRTKVEHFITRSLRKSKTSQFPPGEIIETNGESMWFIQKGVCKITEWISCQSKSYHETYITQGQFIGERNILLNGWNGKQLPLMWPKKRYETTTDCEMVELSRSVLANLLRIEPSIYNIINDEIQSDRMITELKHFNKVSDISSINFWNSFQKNGKRIMKIEQLDVPQGKNAIVGCWTQIRRVVPKDNMDNDLYIKGPSTIWVEPADDRTVGIIYIDKKSDEGPLSSEPSNISLIHDNSHKVRVRKAKHRTRR